MKTPDLSIESAYLFGALFGSFALPLTQGYPLPLMLILTLLASLLGGAIVGITSSFITNFGKVPHLLSSIVTFGIYHGIFQLLSNPYASLASYTNPLMIMPHIAKHPEFLILTIICIVISVIFVGLLYTQLGYSLAIFGNNPSFFRHFKISTSYVFITGIVVANSLAGLAGYLFAQTNNFIEINMGLGKSLFCITALILGKALITKKGTSYFIPACGIFSYFLLQQSLLKIGFNLKYFTTIQALLVLIVLLVLYKRPVTKTDQLGV
jgi:putative ABC transport system permease protein